MHLSVCLQLCFLIYWASTAFGQQGCNVTNKFGEDCRYTCHCKYGTVCSQDGSCSKGCRNGWIGPACQYKDKAFRSAGSFFRNETSKHDTYKYDWDASFKFTWMKLQLREPITGNHSKVSILFRNQSALQFCEKYIVTITDDYTYTFHCDNVMFIDSITIDTDSQRNMKTLYISGGLDNELGLPAGNTSTIWSSRFYKAVEGSTSGYNCTSSLVNTTNADVNNTDILLNHYMFSSLENLDGQDHLFKLVKYNNSEVYSFSDSGHLAFMYMRNNETVGLQLIPYLELFLSVYTNGDILGLCEVHLFEELQCTEIPRYIIDCNRRSNCLNQTDGCLFITGQCPSGCPVGFTDECCTNYAPPKTCPIRKPNRNFIDKTKVV